MTKLKFQKGFCVMSDKKTANNIINLEKLKNLIDTKKSRQVIADKIGCDVSLITKHYNGQKIVTIEYLKKYAEYFEVSTDYLLDLSEAETNDKELQFITDCTGLSVEAVNFLCRINGYKETLGKNWVVDEIIEFFNMLIIKVKNNEAKIGDIASLSEGLVPLYMFYEGCLSLSSEEKAKLKYAGVHRIIENSEYETMKSVVNSHKYEMNRFLSEFIDEYALHNTGLTSEQFNQIENEFMSNLDRFEDEAAEFYEKNEVIEKFEVSKKEGVNDEQKTGKR